jgi:hypothetical protein
MQLGGIALLPLDPAQYLCRAVPAILALAVRPMDLIVVLGDELLVRGDQLGPGLGLAERMPRAA